MVGQQCRQATIAPGACRSTENAGVNRITGSEADLAYRVLVVVHWSCPSVLRGPARQGMRDVRGRQSIFARDQAAADGRCQVRRGPRVKPEDARSGPPQYRAVVRRHRKQRRQAQQDQRMAAVSGARSRWRRPDRVLRRWRRDVRRQTAPNPRAARSAGACRATSGTSTSSCAGTTGKATTSTSSGSAGARSPRARSRL